MVLSCGMPVWGVPACGVSALVSLSTSVPILAVSPWMRAPTFMSAWPRFWASTAMVRFLPTSVARSAGRVTARLGCAPAQGRTPLGLRLGERLLPLGGALRGDGRLLDLRPLVGDDLVEPGDRQRAHGGGGERRQGGLGGVTGVDL